MYPLQVRFFQNALGGEDQLRQRVALALHEILVVSGVKIRQPSLMAPYLNMLLADAFGNYRTILVRPDAQPGDGRLPRHGEQRRAGAPPRTSRRTRTTPARSSSSSRSASNLLNQDGSLAARRQRRPGPRLHAGHDRGLRARLHRLDVRRRRRACPRSEQPAELHGADVALPRRGRGATRPTTRARRRSSTTRARCTPSCPPNQDGAVDLDQALDNIFHHPNVGPFVGAAAHPAPRHVEPEPGLRRARGARLRRRRRRRPRRHARRGRRDPPRPRGARRREERPGLRPPARARPLRHERLPGVRRDERRRPRGRRRTRWGRTSSTPPSVFSYYPHEYEVPGTPLHGPEFGIQSSMTAISRINFVTALVLDGIGSPAPDPGTAVDLSALAPLAGDPAALVSALDRLLLHGTMSTPTWRAVVARGRGGPADEPARCGRRPRSTWWRARPRTRWRAEEEARR